MLLPAIAGTLVLVITAVAIALPAGLGAGTQIRLSDVSFYYHSHWILERIDASLWEWFFKVPIHCP